MPPAVSNYSPLDRAYAEDISFAAPGQPTLEEPIMPIERLGQTVPETDPATNANILQNVQAALRRGAGSIQLVMSTPHTSALGGGVKAYGKEVREELRDMMRYNDLKLTGVEMPTSSMTNMSGFDPQRGGFSDEKREDHVSNVKDAIKFAADIGGGGVDIVSFEFQRNLNDTDWNSKGAKGKPLFRQLGGEHEDFVQIVDKKTGKLMTIGKDQIQHLPINPKLFDPTASAEKLVGTSEVNKEGYLEVYKWDWDTISQVAKRTGIKPAQVLVKLNEVQQESQIRGQVSYYEDFLRSSRARAESATNDEERKYFEDQIKHYQEAIASNQGKLKEIEDKRGDLVPIKDYGVDKTVESYGELGIAAMDETHNQQNKGNPIHVGPELGWPQFFGGHPREFIEVIRKSREQMASTLVKERGMSKSDAEAEAKRHIKGVVDTSHLGMFLKHFNPKGVRTEKERVEKFNEWFIDEMHHLAKVNKEEDIVGGVQLVNSSSGEHAHLPPSQGIFPVIETAKILKEEGGYAGAMVSEGHEEEKFGAGRILLDTWLSFDPNIMANTFGGAGVPRQLGWQHVHQSYFGRPYGPGFVVGEYAPSQEWRLWSEVPLE